MSLCISDTASSLLPDERRRLRDRAATPRFWRHLCGICVPCKIAIHLEESPRWEIRRRGYTFRNNLSKDGARSTESDNLLNNIPRELCVKAGREAAPGKNFLKRIESSTPPVMFVPRCSCRRFQGERTGSLLRGRGEIGKREAEIVMAGCLVSISLSVEFGFCLVFYRKNCSCVLVRQLGI